MNPILYYKKKNNLSYSELSEKCKVDGAVLQKFAMGKRDMKNMTLETAEKICKGLDIKDPFSLIHQK